MGSSANVYLTMKMACQMYRKDYADDTKLVETFVHEHFEFVSGSTLRDVLNKFELKLKEKQSFSFALKRERPSVFNVVELCFEFYKNYKKVSVKKSIQDWTAHHVPGFLDFVPAPKPVQVVPVDDLTTDSPNSQDHRWQNFHENKQNQQDRLRVRLGGLFEQNKTALNEQRQERLNASGFGVNGRSRTPMGSQGEAYDQHKRREYNQMLGNNYEQLDS